VKRLLTACIASSPEAVLRLPGSPTGDVLRSRAR
jgi:hypothetical protein